MTIATRLAEAQNSVAVIEAGSFYELDNGNLSQIPSDDALYASPAPEQSSIQPLVDWGFITEPQLVSDVGDGRREEYHSEVRTFHRASGK